MEKKWIDSVALKSIAVGIINLMILLFIYSFNVPVGDYQFYNAVKINENGKYFLFFRTNEGKQIKYESYNNIAKHYAEGAEVPLYFNEKKLPKIVLEENVKFNKAFEVLGITLALTCLFIIPIGNYYLRLKELQS